jgi:hypothetical protein
MAKLTHSSTRRGFSTHNSVGTDNLSNPNTTGGTQTPLTLMQPGMIELKTQQGVPYYLWVDVNGDLRLGTAIPTAPDSDGTIVGTQS